MNTIKTSHPSPRRKPFGAVVLLFALVLLTGCTPQILPESWPGLTVQGPLTEDGRYDARYIYVAYRNTIFRIDLKRDATNRELAENQRATDRLVDWAAHAPNNAQMFAAPTLATDGTLYVGSYNHSVYAFSPTAPVRNQPLSNWSATPGVDRIIASGVIYQDRLLLGQGDRGIKAYDIRNGSVVATFADAKFGTWGAPIIDEERKTLYFGSMDQYLYALDLDTLALQWRVNVNGAVAATPLLHEGIMYVPTINREMIMVDVSLESAKPPLDQSDRIVRRFATEGWVWATPVLRDKVLYFGDLKGYVYALDAETLTQLWRANDPERPGGIRGKVAVVGDKVIAASESKYVRAYSTFDGLAQWTSSPAADERILGDVVAIGGDVIVTTMSEANLVVAFDLASGGRNWSVKIPSPEDVQRLVQAP